MLTAITGSPIEAGSVSDAAHSADARDGSRGTSASDSELVARPVRVTAAPSAGSSRMGSYGPELGMTVTTTGRSSSYGPATSPAVQRPAVGTSSYGPGAM